MTDGLTGAFTYGYLREILELEIQRALTHKSELSLLIIDIDDFKGINDRHGHLFGDRLIKEAAETITANIRGEDILARYGGDEFLVIMPGAANDTASHAADRICKGIANNGFKATVSVGAATFAGDEKQDSEDLINEADANMYEAKREGKNRVSLKSSKEFS